VQQQKPPNPKRSVDAIAVRDGVCVLGMHRSGTSLVAGLLGILGLELGPEEAMLPPLPANPKGYWELADLVKINDLILAEFGGSWDRLPELPDGWEQSERLEGLRERARTVLRERFSGSAHWGWKDPRTCVTLPFWQSLVPGVRHVICIRNPVDVADSLRTREGHGRPWEEGIIDWLRHTSLALIQTSGSPRIVVHYEDFFEDLEARVKTLARFLGLERRLEEPGVLEQVREFVDPGLVHAHTTPARMAADPRVAKEAAGLYMMLRLASALEARGEPGRDPTAAYWGAIDRLAGRYLGRLPE
jgi:hypothetical protein